jgi:phosphohistidine phosphatase
MRRLMLLRHAKSDWSVGGQSDAERALAPRGRAVAPVVGRYMAQHGLRPDLALVSPARRTRETWDLVGPAFDAPPPAKFDKRLYEARAAAILAVIQQAPDEAHTLLLVGHNPGMQELANLLAAAGDRDARQALAEKFPTAALAVIDLPVDRWKDVRAQAGRLDRFVTPRALTLEAD